MALVWQALYWSDTRQTTPIPWGYGHVAFNWNLTMWENTSYNWICWWNSGFLIVRTGLGAVLIWWAFCLAFPGNILYLLNKCLDHNRISYGSDGRKTFLTWLHPYLKYFTFRKFSACNGMHFKLTCAIMGYLYSQLSAVLNTKSFPPPLCIGLDFSLWVVTHLHPRLYGQMNGVWQLWNQLLWINIRLKHLTSQAAYNKNMHLPGRFHNGSCRHWRLADIPLAMNLCCRNIKWIFMDL